MHAGTGLLMRIDQVATRDSVQVIALAHSGSVLAIDAARSNEPRRHE